MERLGTIPNKNVAATFTNYMGMFAEHPDNLKELLYSESIHSFIHLQLPFHPSQGWSRASGTLAVKQEYMAPDTHILIHSSVRQFTVANPVFFGQ